MRNRFIYKKFKISTRESGMYGFTIMTPSYNDPVFAIEFDFGRTMFYFGWEL